MGASGIFMWLSSSATAFKSPFLACISQMSHSCCSVNHLVVQCYSQLSVGYSTLHEHLGLPKTYVQTKHMFGGFQVTYLVNPFVLERCHLSDLLHCCSTLFAIFLFQLHQLHGCCLLCLLDLLCNSCSAVLWCLVMFDFCCFVAAVVLRLGKSAGKLLLCQLLISYCLKVPANCCNPLHYNLICCAFRSRAGFLTNSQQMLTRVKAWYFDLPAQCVGAARCLKSTGFICVGVTKFSKLRLEAGPNSLSRFM